MRKCIVGCLHFLTHENFVPLDSTKLMYIAKYFYINKRAMNDIARLIITKKYIFYGNKNI